MLPTSSSTKIAYDLRPSKQAERYILVEFLHKLRETGIRMEDYRYVGFGAQYFYDFRLFHQLLGIRELTSVEGSPLESVQKRCQFNKPYGDLELVLGLSTDYLRDASPDHNYLIWLDYDFGYGEVCHNDLTTILPKFRSGTILIVTIDLERPEYKEPRELRDELAEQVPPEVLRSVAPQAFSPSQWPMTIIQLIERSITLGMYGRTDTTFLRLFSFEYRDTHRMYTFGGVLADLPAKRKIQRVARAWQFHCKDKLRNVRRIPRLMMTRKERGYLDELALSSREYKGEIGVSVEDFKAYQEYYRYLPLYSEIV
jgi:hypothetical protein